MEEQGGRRMEEQQQLSTLRVFPSQNGDGRRRRTFFYKVGDSNNPKKTSGANSFRCCLLDEMTAVVHLGFNAELNEINDDCCTRICV
jgi:hypothetical protein